MTRPIATFAQRDVVPGDYWVDRERSWFPKYLWFDHCEINFGAMGLMRVRVRDDRLAIVWDAHHVDPDALQSVLAFLERSRPHRRCDLRYLRSGWIEEWYPEVEQAAERIQEIQRNLNVVRLMPGVTINRMPLDHLAKVHPHLRESYIALQHTDPFDWARSELGRAGIVYERDGDSLIYQHVGDRTEVRRMLGDGWWHKARGRRAEDAFSDDEFNRRLNVAYDLARSEGTAIIEEALANVEQAGRRLVVPFSRLTVPLGPNHLAVVVRRRNGPDNTHALSGAAAQGRPAYLEVA